MDESRYAGRPLLRILDCYVLAVTGNLAPEMELKVADVVGRTFGGERDWKASVRRAINLPLDMDDRIRALWRSQPLGTDPVAFASAVSDENFAPMLDGA